MDNKAKQALVERFWNDTGITYSLTYKELDVLLEEVGEMETIVDAIKVKKWWLGGTEEDDESESDDDDDESLELAATTGLAAS